MVRAKFQAVIGFLVALMASSYHVDVMAQEFPTKLVKMVTTAGPGLTLDLATRTIAADLTKIFGQSVITENMGAAGGVVGFRYVAKQPADGHTLLLIQGISLGLPNLVKDLQFDLRKDFAAVSMVTSNPLYLVTSSANPYGTMAELVSFAKTNPGKLNFGITGRDSLLIYIQAVKLHYGIEIVDVPYTGGAYVQAVLANQVQLGMFGSGTAIRDSQNKSIRILALTGDKRVPEVTNAPTFAELGIAGIENNAYILLTVGGTPKPIVNKINAAVAQSLKQSATQEQFKKFGLTIVLSSPEELAKFMDNHMTLLTNYAQKAGIQPQ